jgi:hypothetical protein
MKCTLFIGKIVPVKRFGNVTFIHEKVTGWNPK